MLLHTYCYFLLSKKLLYYISISILVSVIGSLQETNHDRRWIAEPVLDDWSSSAAAAAGVTQDFIMPLDSFHWRMTTNHDLQNGFHVVIQLRQFIFELRLFPFQF